MSDESSAPKRLDAGHRLHGDVTKAIADGELSPVSSKKYKQVGS